MSFVNSSQSVYVTGQKRLSLSFAAAFSCSVTPQTFTGKKRLPLSFAPEFAFVPVLRKRGRFGVDFKAAFSFDVNLRAHLILSNPAPILDNVTNGFVAGTGKLYANDVEIPYRRATYNAPRDSLGASFAVEMAKARLSLLPDDAEIRFDMKIAGADYETVFDSAKINSKNFSRGWSNNAPNDSLSFSTLIDLGDRFALAPRKNIICFDKAKSNVDISNIEKLFDSDGVLVQTQARAFNGLSLYQALKIAFVEICGFASVQTNIPNYPLTRVDFNISQSAKESVAPFLGFFKPIFIPVAGNVLRILNGRQMIPGDFTPTTITADDYAGLGLQDAPKAFDDGYRVSFVASSDYASFVLRYPNPVVIETGKIFNPDYSKQTIEEIYRDYYDDYYSDKVTKTELIKRTTTITDSVGFTLSETVEEFQIDGQGKLIKQTKTETKKIPLPSNGFNPSLSEVANEVSNYEYQTDIADTRRVILKSVKTSINEIVATDSDNKYFNADFSQAFSEAHRSGNLSDSLSYSSFPQPVKTITKIYDQLGSGQIRVTETVIDILRDNFPVVTISETTNGDVSINAGFARQREIVIYRAGVNKSLPGKPLRSVSAGEVPLFFALPIFEKQLVDSDGDGRTGTATFYGYNPDLRRGQFALVLDRNGENLGKYLIAGFSWTFENGQVVTVLELEEVI